MRIETAQYNILIPDTGKYLYNAKERVISDKVYLGKNADASQWAEITQAEKDRIEAEWAAEEATENEQNRPSLSKKLKPGGLYEQKLGGIPLDI